MTDSSQEIPQFVCSDWKWYFIDLNGQEAFPGQRYDNAWSFSQGRVLVKRDGKFHSINLAGQLVE